MCFFLFAHKRVAMIKVYKISEGRISLSNLQKRTLTNNGHAYDKDQC